MPGERRSKKIESRQGRLTTYSNSNSDNCATVFTGIN